MRDKQIGQAQISLQILEEIQDMGLHRDIQGGGGLIQDYNPGMALNAKYNQSDVAGIFIRWNDTAKEGDALVLGFNWTKMYELTGTDTKDWKGPFWASKLVMDMRMMKYWNQPDMAVSTFKEFRVDAGKLAQLQNAGMHPLKIAGVM